MTNSFQAVGQARETSDENLKQVVSSLQEHNKRVLFFHEHPEYVNPDVVTQLVDWIPTLLRSDRRAAATVVECAALLARKLKQPQSSALALRARANLMHVSGRNKLAVRCHERAYSLFVKAGDQEQAARTLSASIQPLILVGEYDRALTAARKAKSIFTARGNLWRLARLELNTGNIYDRQDLFPKALACYERAYRYLEAHEDQDPEAVGIVLHNMAGCMVLLNDFRGAMATYEKARSFAKRKRMAALLAQADYNIAWLHYLRGEYSLAIHLLRTTRDVSEKLDDHQHFGLCHLDLSEIYLELNMSGEAEEAALAAREIFRRVGLRYEEAKSAANAAIALTQQNKFADALVLFSEARTLFIRENNKIWCALLHLYEAVALHKSGEVHAAMQQARSALRHFRSEAFRTKAVLCRLLLARIEMRATRLTAAADQVRRALKSLQHIESPALSCQAHTLMAQVQTARRLSASAFQHYQKAKTHLDALRAGIGGDELKISFMRDRSDIYEGLVHLCLARTDATAEAIAYIEQAKSRSLLDLLTTDDHDAQVQDTAEQEQLRSLRAELNCYRHQLELEQRGPGPAPNRTQKLRSESQRIEREMLRIRREASNAPCAEPAAGGTVLAPEAIQASISPEVTILEYYKVNQELVAALITHDRLALESLGPMDAIESAMSSLRFQMAKLRLGPEYAATFEQPLLRATQHHLQELYRLVIAPVRSGLKTPCLVVAPQGSLHHLPFHALFDGSRYLIDDFTIAYSPSASIYALGERRRTVATNHTLVIGVPDPTIPLVEEEATSVAQTIPGAKLVIGSDGTCETLAREGASSRIIHIATHGQFREDQPMFSSIRLADSWLSVYDLMQLRLPAELITLSGCSTGLNVISAGDEIMGLARGLIRAGAQSALLSLWDVNDRSTTEFMKTFYSTLARGDGRAEAVRNAALRLRESHRHPYYWAPFFLVGTGFSRTRPFG